ncbi:hypothetical protein BOTBODRAFT_35489 [Botryobasidium botryosum FD-172 SS1]|uniref:non-specific serine/threonine protein kinase n=1 Tax=Botryobasidium botryosum (strain FD-172 SS1) TaxID=930990 RepID=A0A067M5Y8_BOTB1|nr:hypothetical protein BOTBODRAFT_35489 [Botryobasidium botryosum FD-172 SS1]
MSSSKASASSPPKLGEYAIIRDIGEGTFGKVKLAVHTVTGVKVAMKFISKARIIAMKMKTRVTREIEYLKMLRHPHIIKLYEVISTPTDIIMVIEYAGGELFNYIVEHGRMSENSARRFFQQMMYAMSYSHALKIVHRDLKPENVLLDDDLNVKIADFGLSNSMTDGDFLRTSCGSPNYAAPEVISGKLYAGPEIDVWSCGVILYVMLCGRLPFEDENVPTLFHKITGGVYHLPNYLSHDAKYLISGMLAVDPMKRLTVAEILDQPWTKVGLSPYLLRPPTPAPGPLLDTLSSLVASSPGGRREDAVKGLGHIDEGVLIELANSLAVNVEDVRDALKKDGQNAVKVAYCLCRDRKRLGDEPTDLDDDEFFSPRGIEPIWIPTSDTPSATRRNQLMDDYDDEDEVSTMDWVEDNHFAVLDSSLVNGGDLSEPPLPLLGSPTHHLQSYANSRSLRPSFPSQSTNPRPRHTHSAHKQPKWHFGIRSRSPPMEVMLEIYQTLKALGMEWREKGGGWGAQDDENEEDVEDGDAEGEDAASKEDSDIYFVEARWRIRDVVVRMDLQLYQVDASNYLVDFRNKGYYSASTASNAASVFDPHTPSSTTSTSESPLANGQPSETTGSTKNKSDRDKKDIDVTSPFLFLDCACRLIVELAGG